MAPEREPHVRDLESLRSVTGSGGKGRAGGSSLHLTEIPLSTHKPISSFLILSVERGSWSPSAA